MAPTKNPGEGGLWLKKPEFQNGTLVSGSMEQNLRNACCLILSHTHIHRDRHMYIYIYIYIYATCDLYFVGFQVSFTVPSACVKRWDLCGFKFQKDINQKASFDAEISCNFSFGQARRKTFQNTFWVLTWFQGGPKVLAFHMNCLNKTCVTR